MSEPKVAVILLNYNGRDLLREYLPSVLDLDYENYSVIVVDNNSSDGSVELLQNDFPEVEVVENDANVGLSRGNNRGTEAAPDADYYWFLNTDVRVKEQSLSKLVDYIDSEPDVGVVIPRINFMDSDTIQSLGYHYDIFGFSYRNYEGETEPPSTSPYEVPYGMLAALLVDRETWDDVGGFDEESFIYGDDDYLGLQAWLRGHRVEVVPDSVVYHEGGASKAASTFDVYHNARNRTRCYLLTLQLRTILFGFPGFTAYLLGQIGMDLAVRRDVRVAAYRLYGYISALLSLKGILDERSEIQSERRYPDSRFLSPLFD